MAGAEAQVHFALLAARLKSCPCYKAPWVGFFRSLRSPVFYADVTAWLKPGPFKTGFMRPIVPRQKSSGQEC